MQGSGVLGGGLMRPDSWVCQMQFSGKGRQIGHRFPDRTCLEAEIVSSVVSLARKKQTNKNKNHNFVPDGSSTLRKENDATQTKVPHELPLASRWWDGALPWFVTVAMAAETLLFI